MTRHRITPLLLLALGWVPSVLLAQEHTAGRLTRSFHVGSANPLGFLDSLSDANIHFDIDLSYRLARRTPSQWAFNAKLLLGLNQFTAEIFTGIRHPRWINASLDLQAVSPPSGTGLRRYVQAGPGVYWPKSGPAKAGFNIGVGEQVPLGGVFSLEFGLDYHQVQVKPVERFITVQLGVLYR
jgi:hypothetical protein